MKFFRSFAILAIIGLLASCSADKKMAKAFKQGKYQKVINYYTDVLQKQPNNGKANFYVAESFRQSNRIAQAENFYAKANGAGVNDDSVKLYYAKALQANGKYDEAKEQLEDLQANAETEPMRKRAAKEIAGLSGLQNLEQKESYYKIKNLDAINTPFGEFSPTYLNGELYFASSRSNGKIYEASGTPFLDLFRVETKGANVDIATVKALPATINDENTHEASVTFTPDGRTMVFAKSNTGKRKGADDVDLYIARFRNGTWTEPTLININTPKNWAL